MVNSQDYLLEKRLKELDPGLHRRFTDGVVVLHRMLTGYLKVFPEYTDHSETHGLSVVRFCNEIVGKDNVDRLNADEIYVLLMGCYLHDVGMGISERDFREFCPDEDTDIQNTVRKEHHELSARLIYKYAQLFDFPSDAHTFAAAQIARGHRVVDLFDETEYPAALIVDNGNTICLPYLSAVVRLADEIDVAAERKSETIIDTRIASTEKQKMELAKHAAVRKVTVEKESFILDVDCSDERVYREVINMANKMQETLDYCVRVVEKRTPYSIDQKEVIIRTIK